jgi:hypothetical protein
MEVLMERRQLLILSVAAAATGGGPTRAEGRGQLRVWRDPNCGCCSGWLEHMHRAGFRVEDNLVASVASTRRMLGIPPDLISCHAGAVGGYALEGHVPVEAVLRLLSERPAGVRGLAVPVMPVGAPGMEAPGQPDDTYDVIAFGTGGERSVFMRFRGHQRL